MQFLNPEFKASELDAEYDENDLDGERTKSLQDLIRPYMLREASQIVPLIQC